MDRSNRPLPEKWWPWLHGSLSQWRYRAFSQRKRVYSAHYLESGADRRHQEVRDAGGAGKPSGKRIRQRRSSTREAQFKHCANPCRSCARPNLAHPTIGPSGLRLQAGGCSFQPLAEGPNYPLRPPSQEKPLTDRR